MCCTCTESIQHSYFKSFSYLTFDMLMAAGLFYASTHIDSAFTNEQYGNTNGFLLRHVLWTAYWITQGIVMTGLWVQGHECGHGGFSANETVNDCVGWVVHSALMVPYFSWSVACECAQSCGSAHCISICSSISQQHDLPRSSAPPADIAHLLLSLLLCSPLHRKMSHRRHHGATGNIDHDEVFVPEIHDDSHLTHDDHNDSYASDYLSVMSGVLSRLQYICTILFLGWPAYLINNSSSNKI